MAAVGNGFVDCANLLLSEGANMLALDMYHRSALHRAVSSSNNFHDITFLTSFFLNSFVQKIRVVWFYLAFVQTPLSSDFYWGRGGGGLYTG